METERVEEEKYFGQISLEYIFFLVFILSILATLLVRWFIHSEPDVALAVVLFTIAFLCFLIIGKRFTGEVIILTQEAFIQKGLEAIVNWEDIDHIVFSPRKFRKILDIYYRKDHQIKKLRTLYASVENKEQLLASLRRFSTEYKFAFDEK